MSTSRPAWTARIGSGSGLFFFSSANISAVWYGDEDQMILRRGKVSVRRTSRCWADLGLEELTSELLAEREVVPVPDDEKP